MVTTGCSEGTCAPHLLITPLIWTEHANKHPDLACRHGQAQSRVSSYLRQCAIIVPNADDAVHVWAKGNAANLARQAHSGDWRQQGHWLLLLQ
jgi:hypothetical protein